MSCNLPVVAIDYGKPWSTGVAASSSPGNSYRYGFFRTFGDRRSRVGEEGRNRGRRLGRSDDGVGAARRLTRPSGSEVGAPTRFGHAFTKSAEEPRYVAY